MYWVNPSDVVVDFSIRDERLKNILKLDDVKHFTITYHCKLTIERILELYREYYEGYVNRLRVKVGEKRLRAILSFKATWYIDGFSVEFDGFKLKLNVRGDLEKLIGILKLFRDKSISIEVDLSS